jgi:predicted RNA-binding protein with PUA-like domain
VPATSYWLIKSEPSVYPWDKLVEDGKTQWTGVRNFTARNNLRAMKKGDLCLYYHSNEGKEIVGVAKVVKDAYADPTAEEGDWSCVDVAPVKPLVAPVSLATIKSTKSLAKMEIIRLSRLSVTKVAKDEWAVIAKLSKTKI